MSDMADFQFRIRVGLLVVSSPLWGPLWLLGWAWEQVEELFP